MRNVNPAILAGLCLAGAPIGGNAAGEATGSWHFTALLDGERIGEHDFVVSRHGHELVVDNVAHFKVVVAFIPVYVYDHENHEVWDGGCVTSISSRTNDNGHKGFVLGALQGQAFEVHSSRGALTLPACVRTFAYWDESLLSRPPLLNSQTGELQSVTVTADGVQSITVGTQTLAAKRYSLRGAHLWIDVWYTDAGAWVALESKLDSGRMLRYEIR